MNLVEMFESYSAEKGFGPRVYHVEGVGFATYHLYENECYIEDIYIAPEKRNTNEGSKIADSIVEIAKKYGISNLTGSVIPNANGSTTSLKVLLGYGFKLHSSIENKIIFMKEI